MAGYSGYSKSNNAIDAEAEGRFPLSHAIGIVAKAAGVTRKVARAALDSVGSHEWHHSSKKFNRVAYYDTAEVVRWLKTRPIVANLEAAGFKARIRVCFDRFPGQSGASSSELAAELEATYAAIAAECGTDAKTVKSAYYNDWSGEN